MKCKYCNNGHFGYGDVECVNGVLIDIDEFTEGYDPNVIRPPAPCHPARCQTCGGTGEMDGGDCPDCDCGYRGIPDFRERLGAA